MAQKCPAVGEGEFRLFLPRFDNDKNKIKTERYKKYVNRMNSRFKGSSSWRIGGCFVDEGKEQCEGGAVIIGIRDFENPNDNKSHLSCEQREELLQKDKVFVKKLSNKAGREFGQTSVLSVFDRIQDATLELGKFKKKLSSKDITTEKAEGKKIFQEIF